MDTSTEINNTGVRHFLNQQFGKAEKCYREALELNPENATVLNNMGLLYHQKKRYEEAIEYFEEAIRIKPKDTFYVNAGNAAACLNRVEEAESRYLKALEANSNSVSAHKSLAKLYEYTGDFKKAAPLWTELVRITGKEEFKVEYAQNLLNQKKYSKAVEILYNQVSKESSRVWYLVGICEYQLKNYGWAVSCFKKGLAIDPDDEDIRHYLAVTYVARGEAEKGILQLDKILRVNPENYRILTEKGVILLSENQPSRALELFEKSLSIHPEYDKAKKYRDMAVEILRESDKDDDVEDEDANPHFSQ
ncbi:tetratricopeptide repeat protein [Halalkalibaculum sp. DA3122]|uniref:tetratricopeptide repeat protein n=1 Tax=unclassified Halalkalibaculum TaxID=2964617 RepID=UPI0037547D0E